MLKSLTLPGILGGEQISSPGGLMKIAGVLRLGLAAALLACGLTQAEAARKADSNDVLTGVNLFGRTGLFFSDTAQVPKEGRGSFVGSLLYGSGDDIDFIEIPLGGNYGVAENF